jgi:hypothetical protein
MYCSSTIRHSHDGGTLTFSAAAPHVHVSFLGFESTMPSSDRDGQERQNAETDLVFIAPSNAASGGAHVDLQKSISRLPTWPSATRRSVFGLDEVITRFSEASSIPLCDRARRERSGVLII